MILSRTLSPRLNTSDARREAFVAVAREEFFTCGYGATSMSAVSAKVGGSKTTLWAYFPSKQDLFAAVLDDLIERYGRALEVALDPGGDVETELKRFGDALLDTLHSQPIIDMHRLVIGEASRFPELGRMMYERGQARGKARLRAYIQAAMDQGKLLQGDVFCAGAQFAGMLQSGTVQLRMLGIIETVDPDERARELDGAVRTFLQTWAPRA